VRAYRRRRDVSFGGGDPALHAVQTQINALDFDEVPDAIRRVAPRRARVVAAVSRPLVRRGVATGHRGRDVRTKMGTAFRRGDKTLAREEEDGSFTAYSVRNAVSSAIGHHDLRAHPRLALRPAQPRHRPLRQALHR